MAPPIHNISKRVYSGLILAGVFGLIILRAPLFLICPMLIAIVVIAMLEFYAIIRQIGIPVFKNLGIGCGIILICITWGIYIFQGGARAAEYELAVLFGSFVAICIRQFPQKFNGQPIMTIACTIFGILYIPFLFNFFIKLGLSWGQNNPGYAGLPELGQGGFAEAGFLSSTGLTGRLLSLYLIAVVKCTDIGAFLIGIRFGKHKLFPRLSPSKTWEGFFGGLLFGVAVSLILFMACNGQFGHKIMTLSDALFLGILLPLFGMVGDLIESLLKRAGGAKDAGSIIPGMGGLLDVLDSLLLAVPFFYFYVLWFLPTI